MRRNIIRHILLLIVISVSGITHSQEEIATRIALSMHEQLNSKMYDQAFHSSSLLRREVSLKIMVDNTCLFSEYVALCNNAGVVLDIEQELEHIMGMYRNTYQHDNNKYFNRINSILTHYYRQNKYNLVLFLIEKLLEDKIILSPQQQAELLIAKGWSLNYCRSPFEAYQAFSDAMTFCKINFGEHSQSYAKAMNGMAYECRYLKKDALPIYFQLLDIYKGLYTEESFEIAVCYDNIGATYKQKEILDSAFFYTDKSLNIFKNIGAPSQDIAKCYNNLGTIKIEQGDTATAYALYAMAFNYSPSSIILHNQAKIFYNKGDYNAALELLLQMSDNYQNRVYPSFLAECYAALGNQEKFVEYEEKFLENARVVMQNNFRKMISGEREQYRADNHDCNVDSLFPIASKQAYGAAKICFDYLLTKKSLLLSFNKNIERLVESSGNMSLRKMYSDYTYLKKMSDVNKSFEARADSVELKILQNLYNYGVDYTSLLQISTTDIAAQLGPKELAIEFYAADEHDACRIYAVVLEPNGKTTVCFVCHKDDALKGYNIWIPLKKYFANYETIYFALDGVLHLLPIESYIETINTKNNNLRLYRLSSTRELMVHQEKMNGRDAYFYGGIVYDDSNEDVSIATKKGVDKSRGNVSGLSSLPGTLLEIKRIVEQIQETNPNRLIPHLRVGRQGTESSFKDLDGKRVRLVHISTHGYYLNDHDFMMEEFQDKYDLDNPMNRSGLYMAGAQLTLWGEHNPDEDDGILTAQEISMLDFRGMELIVMSACDTGKGDLRGDGVFGLQRGFKKAGAQSILMSLWKVDDEATCLLMTEFYKKWIGEKMTKHDALEKAKQIVRSHKEKGWDDPKYWAAFILLDGLD